MVKKIRELNEGGVIRDGNMYVYDEASTGITKKVSHGIVKENIGDYVMEKVSNELTSKANIDLSNIDDNGKNVIKMYGGGSARYDYNRAIGNLHSGFRAPTDGLFFIEYWNAGGDLWCELHVNGIKVYHNGSGSNYGNENEHESGLIPLSKDDVVTWNVSGNRAQYYAAFFQAK